MVLTTAELIGSLQNEVRILLHLVSKIEPSYLEYRPTPKQRSTLELLRYLTLMGPELIKGAKAGTFDTEAWSAAEKVAAARSFEETVEALKAHHDQYASLLGDMPDSAFREEINIFGYPTSRGAFITNLALCGCAAYRTQLFLYLKACGREELGTMNLWAGADAPAAG